MSGVVAVTATGIAYAHCPTCGAFETRTTLAAAQRWLDLHTAYTHTAGGCHACHACHTQKTPA